MGFSVMLGHVMWVVLAVAFTWPAIIGIAALCYIAIDDGRGHPVINVVASVASYAALLGGILYITA